MTTTVFWGLDGLGKRFFEPAITQARAECVAEEARADCVVP